MPTFFKATSEAEKMLWARDFVRLLVATVEINTEEATTNGRVNVGEATLIAISVSPHKAEINPTWTYCAHLGCIQCAYVEKDGGINLAIER